MFENLEWILSGPHAVSCDILIAVLSHVIDKLVSSEYMFVTSVSRLFSPTHQNPIYERYTFLRRHEIIPRIQRGILQRE